MKTYCRQNDGDCDTCSLVNYGRACHNIPLTLFGGGWVDFRNLRWHD